MSSSLIWRTREWTLQRHAGWSEDRTLTSAKDEQEPRRVPALPIDEPGSADVGTAARLTQSWRLGMRPRSGAHSGCG
jgi:hypothetical protein